MNVVMIPRYVLIESTDDAAPNHLVVTPYAGAGALREATCQAIYGRKSIDLDSFERDEFSHLWNEFWKMGRLAFTPGGAGLLWAQLNEGA